MIAPAPRLSYCADQLRQGDRERFLTALFAPAARREALFGLYAFNLELARIVESVREPTLGAIRLQWWREAVDGLYQGVVRRHPVVEALAAGIAAMPRPLVDRMIDGREFDLDDAPPASFNALVGYAAETGGVLTELAAHLLAEDGPSLPPGARLACQEAGIAYVLAGVARAVPFHAGQGRVLLPADLLAAEGIDARDVVDGRDRAACARVVQRIVEEAGKRLGSARACRDPAIRVVLPALLPATLADLTMRSLGRAGCDPFRLPPRPPSYRLQLRLLRKAAMGRF